MLRPPRTPRTPRAETDHFLGATEREDTYQPLHQPANLRQLPAWYQRSAKSIAIWGVGVCLILWFATSMSWSPSSLKKGATSASNTTTFTKKTLPIPLAIILPGEEMHRWTVAMPDRPYPLASDDYRALCRSVQNVSMTVHEMHLGHAMAAHTGYYATDDMFVDVAGDLPEGTCDRTLTFLMESGLEGGMGAVLMGVWLAYGLAKKEGREFFVLNGDWIYGRYEDYFPPMRKSTCKAPPPEMMLPCPHQTAHLIITTSTYAYVFGHMFEEEFENPRKMGVERSKPIFDMIRTGYEALSTLTDELESIVGKRVAGVAGLAVAVQVRRGNKHPLEWKYQKEYLPIERYLDAATNQTGSTPGPINYFLPNWTSSPIWIASDDPEVYHMPQVLGVKGLEAAQTVRVPKTAYVGAGDMWALSAEERKIVAEGYLLDQRILGAVASNNGWTVCAVGAYACRILAVAMGWELAIEHGHWMNVDGDFDWSGIKWG